VRPLASCTAAGVLAWDMKQGKLIRDFTLPTTGNHIVRVQLATKRELRISFLKIFTVITLHFD